MFCCGVCNIMFTGVYPECVLTTPCGHLFHSECILHCLNRLPKCPFCTLHVMKKQLIKLHFQVDKNWIDTANALKTKVNKSVINLDETLNETLQIKNEEDSSCSKNDSVVVIDSDDSFIDFVPELLPIYTSNQVIKSSDARCFQSKTLLTTSLSGLTLTKRIRDFLSILNDIIRNSTIQTRLLITEKNLIQAAADEGYTNIIIISMKLGNPIGMTFMDLKNNYKTDVSITSFECSEYESVVDKIKDPKMTIRYDQFKEKLNKPQEFVLNFFSTIFPKQSEEQYGVHEICISPCLNCNAMKFLHNSTGLSFCMAHNHCLDHNVVSKIQF